MTREARNTSVTFVVTNLQDPISSFNTKSSPTEKICPLNVLNVAQLKLLVIFVCQQIGALVVKLRVLGLMYCNKYIVQIVMNAFLPILERDGII